MKQFRLDDMTNGWFVGDFTPAALRTRDAEVAVKRYAAGDREARHYHKVGTEITLVLTGEVRMSGTTCRAGEIIVLDPGEGTDFAAVTDATTVVVKLPSVAADKFTA